MKKSNKNDVQTSNVAVVVLIAVILCAILIGFYYTLQKFQRDANSNYGEGVEQNFRQQNDVSPEY